jgi:hypothetical protein
VDGKEEQRALQRVVLHARREVGIPAPPLERHLDGRARRETGAQLAAEEPLRRGRWIRLHVAADHAHPAADANPLRRARRRQEQSREDAADNGLLRHVAHIGTARTKK